jgi:hypothetical protein
MSRVAGLVRTPARLHGAWAGHRARGARGRALDTVGREVTRSAVQADAAPPWHLLKRSGAWPWLRSARSSRAGGVLGVRAADVSAACGPHQAVLQPGELRSVTALTDDGLQSYTQHSMYFVTHTFLQRWFC